MVNINHSKSLLILWKSLEKVYNQILKWLHKSEFVIKDMFGFLLELWQMNRIYFEKFRNHLKVILKVLLGGNLLGWLICNHIGLK